MSVFDYVAFFAMAVVFCGIIYLVIWLGDLPGNIARQRNHPQAEAITAMAWLGLLFTGGVVYIAAFVWAFYKSPDLAPCTVEETEAKIKLLQEHLAHLQQQRDSQGEQS